LTITYKGLASGRCSPKTQELVSQVALLTSKQ
jgi:hypothetical protein